MLKQIKYFQAVVKYKSFTEASQACFISQSAMSQQIHSLEQTLNVKLINRENRKISLTPAGEYFYRSSLVLTEDFERMFRETRRIAASVCPEIKIGYLKGYGGEEFQAAVAEFSQKHPDISVDIINGSHEDLYNSLRLGDADIVLNDQRRAFSDEYVNFILAEDQCYIETAARNFPDSSSIETDSLKDMPCILVASKDQQENESSYFRNIIGIKSRFIFAESLEEAHLMILGGRCFMPVEGGVSSPQAPSSTKRLLLTRGQKPITRNYCAFWRADNAGFYVEDFADILKKHFDRLRQS